MASTTAPVAVVSLTLRSGDRDYRLPGVGSRSLLYVFDGRQIGALTETSDGADLVPDSTHPEARLTFWDDAATTLVPLSVRLA